MTDSAVLPTAPGLGSRIWRAYAPLAVLWLAYYAGLRIVLAPFDTEMPLFPERYVPVFVTTLVTFFVAVVAVAYVRYVSMGNVPRSERIARLTANIRWSEVTGIGSIPPLLFVFTLMSMFKAFKPRIPDLSAFTWDPVFIAWDRVLFLGRDGWEVTHALMPWPWATLIIDRFYLAWFVVVLLATCVAAFSPMMSRMRLAYLMTFLLNWAVGGCVLATVFSSVGPVFLDRLSGDMDFVAMLARLDQAGAIAPLWTISGIELLWAGHTNQPGVEPYGISAFPSLHVCMSLLVVLYVQGLGRWWRGLAWAFFAVILFGSVHLGWHYLVDGLAGMAICWVNWRASLWFAGWWLRD
ncbi:MAG: phosphatase PAP2 family protein [Pseudomonadota bacterium]